MESYINANSIQRQKAIKRMNVININILCECALNVLVNTKLTSCAQKRLLHKYLKPYNNELYDLICCKMCLHERRNLCVYLHDCIALLLKMLLPSLCNLCKKKIVKIK